MSFKKNIIPMTFAILLHVGLVVLLLWNFAFKPEKQDNKFVDSPVKARLVTAPETPKKNATNLKKQQQRQKELEEAKKRLEQKKLEEKKLEEEKQAEQKQQELDKQKAEQEKKLAEQKKLEQQKEEQQKIDQKRKAEAEKKRLAEEAEKKRKADIERKKKEAEAKKKAEAERKRKEAEHKKREEAERKRKELEALEASLDDELFEADKGAVRQTQIMSEVSKIQRAIRAKIIRNWDMPSFEGLCVMRISMGPGGIVLNSESVEGDFEYCESAKVAINRAAPLPSSDDPEVMAELKNLRMTFDPSQK